jgi:predicted MFS family arabinose efflux permease
MMFLYGVLIIIGNLIVSRRIRKIDNSTEMGKILIEVASIVLLIVSFILYIILIS